jgi:hypothetical protein
MTEQSITPPGDRGGYEKRDANVVKIVLYGLGGTILLVVLLVFMIDYFVATREEMVYTAVLKPESVMLRELRVREQVELNSYALIDSAREIYRIPIDRAMELLAEEAYQLRSAAKSSGSRQP